MPGSVPHSPTHDLPMLPLSRRSRGNGILFFLPAVLQPSSRRNSGSRSPSPKLRTPIPEKRDDLESAGLVAPGLALGLGVASGSRRSSDARSRSRPATPEPVAPPPYHGGASGEGWAHWSPAAER
ncbi:hypothetical protein FRC08_017342 [Ceratobasidium sp. 394]|nr:hypothetical protein FRC08_017342 [Ceratobasidium sp. 394]